MSNQDQNLCLVCDGVSIGNNFGVPTCMPCKAFFRRNAARIGVQQFVCENDGDCSVTYKFRRLCNFCRLAKCFRVGMKKSLILSDQEREARNKLVQNNRLKRGIVTKYSCQDCVQSPSLLRITNNSVQCLSPSDQVVLANIFDAYKNTCISAKNAHFQCFPSVQHSSVHKFVNEISLVFPAFVEYIKYIPEFVNIAIEDQLRLVKGHFGTMININESLLYPEPSRNLIGTWLNVFGIDLTNQLLKRNRLFEKFVYDPILIKIVLIILVLSSSNDRNRDGTNIDEICDYPLSIYSETPLI